MSRAAPSATMRAMQVVHAGEPLRAIRERNSDLYAFARRMAEIFP